MHSRILVIIALLLPSSLLAADRIFTVTGIIRGKLDDGQLIIEHHEIPGYMAAMTMAFTVAAPSETTALKSGDEVSFRYRISDEKSVAESFVIIGHKDVPAVAATKEVRRLRAGDRVPEFHLIDESEHPFTNASFKNRFTVMTFIFTRCPVPAFCPAMAIKFGALQRYLLGDSVLASSVRLMSITLDPEFDRPDILVAYGEAVGAKPAIWGFATGDKAEAATLARTFSVFTERNGALLNHTLCTALIGPDGTVIDLWRGNGWKPDEVLTAIRTAQQP